MDFYNQLLAQKLSGGGGGGDSNAAFKALVDGSITEVTADMLQGVNNIAISTFYNRSSLTNVTIPNNVLSIGQTAFYQCTNLISFTVEAITPPTLGNGALALTPQSLVIYVPAESVDAYKVAPQWEYYSNKIQAIPSN